MLEASDEYVEKMLGLDFPGTGAVPPGEAGDTPGVEVTDYGEISQVGRISFWFWISTKVSNAIWWSWYN